MQSKPVISLPSVCVQLYRVLLPARRTLSHPVLLILNKLIKTSGRPKLTVQTLRILCFFHFAPIPGCVKQKRKQPPRQIFRAAIFLYNHQLFHPGCAALSGCNTVFYHPGCKRPLLFRNFRALGDILSHSPARLLLLAYAL